MSGRNRNELPLEVTIVVRRELLRLAGLEEELAAEQAAQVPYWAPVPPSVTGHRAAARALREDADRLLPGAA